MSEPEKNRPPSGEVENEAGTEDFLARWSQRKSEAAKQAASPQLVETPETEDEPVPLTDEDMPPLESLDEDSDYSGFLSPGVSENLRQLALHKLFHSAKFNVTDGLNDYDLDYSKWVPLGDVVTCDMRFAMERAKEKLEQALGLSGEEPPAEAGLAAARESHDTAAEDATTNTDNDEQPTENPDESGTPGTSQQQ
ncbi:MAG: DUF3306 domain-containing protein [Gammaproteobacteria bacterium]|jgi:hypothetical protein|nr:DUF3306 domain-containing protein [Gammaproteobacteria bacterium]